MSKVSCRRCGNGALIMGFISLRCPLCGECVYLPDADEGLMWSEHRLGLMFKTGGWRWMDALEPPGWFIENVV